MLDDTHPTFVEVEDLPPRGRNNHRLGERDVKRDAASGTRMRRVSDNLVGSCDLPKRCAAMPG